MVERLAVNEMVPGSSPGSGAIKLDTNSFWRAGGNCKCGGAAGIKTAKEPVKISARTVFSFWEKKIFL